MVALLKYEIKKEHKMATFSYEAMNSAGQEVKSEIEAITTEEAISKIREQGLFPTKVKEKTSRKLKLGGRATSAGKKPAGSSSFCMKVSGKMLTQFTRQLATL